MNGAATLGWLGIVRLGLVQAALGAIVVLTTSTLNRVMVVELALPALLPGLLVALHYAVQIAAAAHGLRLRRRRAPHAVDHRRHGGAGRWAASAPRWPRRWMAHATAAPASPLAVLAFALIGLGVGAAGTSLLVLLAKRVRRARARRGGHHRLDDDDRRLRRHRRRWPGSLLDPYSPQRLVAVIGGGVAAGLRAWPLLALRGLEGRAADGADRRRRGASPTSAPRCARSGPSRRRAASRSSSSSRCWPTARRT